MALKKPNPKKNGGNKQKVSSKAKRSKDELEITELELAEIQTIFQEIEVAVHPEEVPETQESLFGREKKAPKKKQTIAAGSKKNVKKK